MIYLFVYRDLENGGVQRNLLRLARLLVGVGHTVHFAIAHTSDQEFKVPDYIQVHRATASSHLGLFYQMAKIYEKLRPDIVYSAMPNYNLVALVARIVSRVKPKLIISERSHTSIELSNSRGLYRLAILLAPVTYRLADAIVAVSDETADSIARFARIKRELIAVVHNPVVGSEIARMAKADIDHKWLSHRFRLIVAVGRLVPQKDYPTLLKAFQLLAAAEPKARLVIIGEGELREPLAALALSLGIIDLIEFTGFDRNPYRWMARACLVVLSSKWEGLPTVIIEALACGATVVATDSPSGPRQILGDRLGYLVPVGSPERLAERLHYALDHRIPRSTLLAEARKYSEEAALQAFESVAAKVTELGRA